MTITLQDLQVLEEKATQGEWLVDHLAPNLSRIALQEDGVIATVDRWNAGVPGDLQENRRNAELIAALVNFWRSGGRDLALKGLQAEAMREAIRRAVEKLHGGMSWHDIDPIRSALEQALNERKET